MLLEIITLPRAVGSRGSPPQELRLQCDVCSAEFRKPYGRALRDAAIHRCSQKCVYGSRSSDGVGGHGAGVDVNCAQCSKQFTTVKSLLRSKWGNFCFKKCYADFRATHGELYANNTRAMHTEEVVARRNESIRERVTSPDYVPTMLGKHHTEDAIAKIRAAREANPLVGEKNGMFGKYHVESAKEAMSEKHSALIAAGRHGYGKNNHVSGEHTSPKNGKTMHYRSSWERDMMKFLDDNTSVLTYEYERTRIPYVLRDNKRWYTPDFVVSYADGTSVMYELKPIEFVDNEKTRLKAEAAAKYCSECGISKYQILTRAELKEMGVL